jgi:hypothetical protein
MGVSDEDDDWKSVSSDYDGHPEGRDGEVIILETSASGDSVESILLFPRETRTTLIGCVMRE